MGHRVTWFEVIGSNGDALREFYGSLFEWEFELFPEMKYGTIAGEGSGIGGGIGQAAEGHAYGPTFYVTTPDVTASLEKAVELGGTVLVPETQVMEGTIFGLFSDPEGHTVGLLKGDG